MTLDEAIKQLKDNRALCVNSETEPFTIAYDMAIEALEQEPCEDCISRQMVLDNAYAYGNGLEPDGYCVNVEDIQALPPVTPQEPNTWSLDDAREDFLYDVYKILESLPTNDEANRIIDSFDRVTSGIRCDDAIDLRREKDVEESKKIKSNLYNELSIVRNHLNVILEVLELGQEPILDKIRAEIKALNSEPTVYDVVDGNPIKDAVWETLADVLKIIDKYKAESEGE